MVASGAASMAAEGLGNHGQRDQAQLRLRISAEIVWDEFTVL